VNISENAFTNEKIALLEHILRVFRCLNPDFSHSSIFRSQSGTMKLARKNFAMALVGMSLLLPMATNANMIITEIMENPTKVNDTRGEWFELYNNGTRRVNLKSWTLQDDNSDSIRIRTDLIVQPKQYVVLANSGKAALNGGLPKVD
jgi:Lamin Tail Domain